ncbi:MAG: HAD family hydrolase [Nanoarchaeota archaeon]|nr:HAD family hydrolase [Nanoarchaeota archaeon]
MNKAIYIDRDGTLVEDPNYYVYKLEDFGLLPGVVKGLKVLSKEFIFIIITNQSGIGRGVHTLKDTEKFNEKLINELKKEDIEIKKIYICPHAPEDNCDCRKPSIKFIKEAEKEFDIDLKKSWVIGDKPIDVKMGEKSECKTIYALTGHGKEYFKDLEKSNLNPDFVAEDFLKAAKFIINNIK